MPSSNDKVEVIGADVVARKLRALGKAALQSGGRSLYRSGHKIITDSKKNYVPILTGALESTLQASAPVLKGNTITVTLSAGGPAAPYAVHVHEINKNYHNGRQWKYLLTPATNAVPEVLADLQKELQELLAKQGSK